MTQQLMVHVSLERLWAEAWTGGREPSWRCEVCRAPEVSLPDAICALLAEAPRPTGTIETQVLLHRPMAQIRHLEGLPPVRGKVLAAMVEHQASTFFRKNGHPLVTSAGILPARGDQPQRTLMAAIDVDLADALVEGIGRAGLTIDGCTVADLPGAEALDLLPLAARQTRDRRRLRSLSQAAFVAALAWAMAIGSWAVREGAAVHRTRSELTRLAGARKALLTGQAVRHQAEELLISLDEANAGRHRLQDQFLAVASALPDSAYLTTLTLDTLGRGLLTGGAHRATEVVSALERSHAAPNPRLDGAVAPDPFNGARWERFTILTGEGRP